MKNLIFINGTMGVGKSAVSRELKKKQYAQQIKGYNNNTEREHTWIKAPAATT